MKKIQAAEQSAAGRAEYRSLPRNQLIRKLMVLKIMAPDRLADLRGRLDDDERPVVEGLIPPSPKTSKEIADSSHLTARAVGQSIGRLLRKIENWENGYGLVEKKPKEPRTKKAKEPKSRDEPSAKTESSASAPAIRCSPLQEKLRALQTAGQLGKIEPLFNDTERAIVVAFTASEPPVPFTEIARSAGWPAGRVQSSARNLAKKIENWETAGKFSLTLQSSPNLKNGRAVRRVQKLIQARLDSGQTLDEIKQIAGLNTTECQVLDIYLLPPERISLQQAAERVGRKKGTVVRKVQFIEDKLQGKHPLARHAERYEKMSDSDLIAAIRATGATRLGQLDNYLLKLEARKRGILTVLFPDPRIKILQDAFRAAVARRKPEEIWAELTELERLVLLRRVLVEVPPARGDLAQLHAHDVSNVTMAEKTLLKKLKRKPLPESILKKLKKLTGELGPESIAALEPRMTSREILVLRRRIQAEHPENRKRLAGSISLSHERIRHHELALYHKLVHYQQTGRFELPEHLRDAYFAQKTGRENRPRRRRHRA